MARRPDDEGQGLIEYILILVLVAVVVIVIVALLGPWLTDTASDIFQTLSGGS